MSCDLCALLKGPLLYEDASIAAMLAPKPASVGHVIVAPKQHHVILEQVPDKITGELFTVANRISIALFEGLGVQGTNVLVQNGPAAGQITPHVRVDIIPRQENDGINLLWQPRQLSEEEMSTVEMRLKEAILPLGQEPQKEEKKEEPKPEPKKEMKMDDENYLIKSLRRIP